MCQQSTKEIVCDDYEEEWKKSYEKTIEVTSEAEIFVQRSPIMMMRTPAVEETAGLVAAAPRRDLIEVPQRPARMAPL